MPWSQRAEWVGPDGLTREADLVVRPEPGGFGWQWTLYSWQPGWDLPTIWGHNYSTATAAYHAGAAVWTRLFGAEVPTPIPTH